MGDWTTEVETAEFANALGTATMGVRAKGRFTLRVEFDGDCLHLTGPGAARSLAASGEGAGAALVDARTMAALATRPPRATTVQVRFSAGRLHVAGFSVGAEETDPEHKALLFAFDFTDGDILVGTRRHGRERVVASVFEARVRQAEKAAESAIRTALQSLAQFGVTEADLRAVVSSALERTAKR